MLKIRRPLLVRGLRLWKWGTCLLSLDTSCLSIASLLSDGLQVCFSCQMYCSAVSSLLSGSLYYLLIGPERT